MSARLRLPTGRPLLVDAGLVLVFIALLVDRQFLGIGTPTDIAGKAWWTFPLFLLGDVALLWRRTLPVAAAMLVFLPYAAHAVLTGSGVEGAFELFPALAALYSLGAYSNEWRLVAGILGVVALSAVHDTHDPQLQLSNSDEVWAYIEWMTVLGAFLLAGVVVGTRRRMAAVRAQQQQAEADRLTAIASERAKIARDLHDVVTHNVNVVVMQAMAASGVLDLDPARVREPLLAIEDSGREALAEMRRMLGVLREEDEVVLAPQPGAADVPRLVESLQRTGQEIECRVSGDLDSLPDGMGMVVFRIVQEGLTNAMKHARGAAVAVEVCRDQSGVRLDILNGPGPGEAVRSGAGHGLVGMLERATLFGGTVESQPTEEGGFRVRAWLPLEAVE